MCVQVWRRLCVVCKAEATKRSVKVWKVKEAKWVREGEKAWLQKGLFLLSAKRGAVWNDTEWFKKRKKKDNTDCVSYLSQLTWPLTVSLSETYGPNNDTIGIISYSLVQMSCPSVSPLSSLRFTIWSYNFHSRIINFITLIVVSWIYVNALSLCTINIPHHTKKSRGLWRISRSIMYTWSGLHCMWISCLAQKICVALVPIKMEKVWEFFVMDDLHYNLTHKTAWRWEGK